MTLGTHVALASILYLGGATLFDYRTDALGWLLAAIASLLPDADLPTSKIGRLFWFLSVPLERRFSHSTITHLLSGEATALDVAYRLASLIDAIEGCSDRSTPPRHTH